MSYIKYDFLNWQPDLEDYRNPGLKTADNVIHDVEGYKKYETPTAAAFATNAALVSCPSLVMKSVGTNDQRAVAYINNCTAAGVGFTYDFNIGLFSSGYTTIGNYTTVTSATCTTQFTLNRVVAFAVCELADKLFFVARAEGASNTAVSGTAIAAVNLAGYADI